MWLFVVVWEDGDGQEEACMVRKRLTRLWTDLYPLAVSFAPSQMLSFSDISSPFLLRSMYFWYGTRLQATMRPLLTGVSAESSPFDYFILLILTTKIWFRGVKKHLLAGLCRLWGRWRVPGGGRTPSGTIRDQSCGQKEPNKPKKIRPQPAFVGLWRLPKAEIEGGQIVFEMGLT